MFYLYDKNATQHPDGGRAVNPKYFRRLPKDASKVKIVGDYPEIEAACRAAGVAVMGSEPVVDLDDLEDVADDLDEKDLLIVELSARGIERDRRSSVSTLQQLLDEVTEDGD